jgi:protein O-GlcNAc transferase
VRRQDRHILVKSLADLLLDPPVYNAHSTATDLLWAGVPMLTMPMHSMASRGCASVVAALGTIGSSTSRVYVREGLTV